MTTTVTMHGHGAPRAGGRAIARGGFSIPELLVVLFVVSLLAYVAVPAIEIVRFRMDGAARGAAAALVAAQRMAVKRQHDVVVVFDTAAVRLRIHQDQDNDGAVDDDEPVRTTSFDEGVRFGMGEAPRMAGAAGPLSFEYRHEGLPAVRFLRNGSASEEGTIYLTSVRSGRGVDRSTDARGVRVERATGRVTWYRYDTSGWAEGF